MTRRFRPSRWALLPYAVLGPWIAYIVLVEPPIDVLGVALLLVFGATVARSCWSVGVTLTPAHAVVHGYLHNRRVAWSEVRAVTQEPWATDRQVVLWTPDGPVRLRAPSTVLGLGRTRFERDFHTIGQWWLAHRGADWRPAPASADPWAVRR